MSPAASPAHNGSSLAIAGEPTDEEAAAIVAAVGAFLSSQAPVADPRPWAYRSAWRRAAIEDGLRPDACSITAFGRPASRHSDGSIDLGGSGVS